MMKVVLLALTLLLIAGCGVSPPTATLVPGNPFVEAVYHRLAVDDTIPTPTRQAAITLYHNQPTAMFPDNTGLVLVYEVSTTPDSQTETTKAAVLLAGTAVSVAKQQAVPLTGIEVIFYAGTEPFIGFRVEPPWAAENILATPLSGQLREEIQSQDTTATVTPTRVATPEGQQSG